MATILLFPHFKKWGNRQAHRSKCEGQIMESLLRWENKSGLAERLRFWGVGRQLLENFKLYLSNMCFNFDFPRVSSSAPQPSSLCLLSRPSFLKYRKNGPQTALPKQWNDNRAVKTTCLYQRPAHRFHWFPILPAILVTPVEGKGSAELFVTVSKLILIRFA